LIGAAKVQHKAAIVAELLAPQNCEFRQPYHIFVLVAVALLLLALESAGWRREHEVHPVIRQRLEEVQ